MGLIVKQTKIMQIEEELARITEMSRMAIRMYLSKDAFTKESGARQCEMLKDRLLHKAAELRYLSTRSYLTQKKSIEELYKGLKVCVVRTVEQSKVFETSNEQSVAHSL